MSKLLFSTFDVTKQVFFRGKLSFGLVNISPILPGHVLIVPNRVVPRLADLSPDEIADVFQTAQRVGSVIEKAHEAHSLTVACQDGAAAGQTIPHVHIHILPRKFVDFGGDNDQVYPALEQSEGDMKDSLDKGSVSNAKPSPITMDARVSNGRRTAEEMEKEAAWLHSFFE